MIPNSFHSKHGLYFRREPDGTVLVMYDPDNTDGQHVQMMVPLDPDTWASVVASVSLAGEHGDTFAMAQWVHNAMPHDWVFNREAIDSLKDGSRGSSG
jgi:hypothetical protein